MHLAWASLFALAMIILISRQERVHVGVLAMGLGWILAVCWAGVSLADLMKAFPISLFVMLFGVTLFFGLAKTNGTLDKITHWAIHCARGKTAFLPLIFFGLALFLSMIGPGNITSVAMLAPLAMAVAGRTGISAFFMTIMVVNGANAGAFSPFAPTGIIADQLIDRQGIAMNAWTQVFLPSLLAQSAVAMTWYFILLGQMRKRQQNLNFDIHELVGHSQSLNSSQVITLLAIVVLVMGVAFFKADIGFLALALSALLMLGHMADGEAGIKAVPWSIIMMVCGVSLLIGVMEHTGGLDLFTSLLAKISNPTTVSGVIALVCGIISSYSSSSGVVMPAFIPLVPDLIQKMGGGDAVAIIASINVGSHVVDVSPLSTLGALCIANAAAFENKAKLFHQLLIYGLAMSVYGALICLIFFGWLGLVL